ncbi:protein PFC0760c-like [Brienomyrus brachyistius]|uniref:protein PFC0760c-like n=1 Tax=Brienomyrus brachyistius TaxID=42636 RepID=UPI0020B394DA|nr:protein PFC0760c-like [Brienomyrus brachyistius]
MTEAAAEDLFNVPAPVIDHENETTLQPERTANKSPRSIFSSPWPWLLLLSLVFLGSSVAITFDLINYRGLTGELCDMYFDPMEMVSEAVDEFSNLTRQSLTSLYSILLEEDLAPKRHSVRKKGEFLPPKEKGDDLYIADDVHDIQDKDTGDHDDDEVHDIGLAFGNAEDLEIEQREDGHFGDDNAHDIYEEYDGHVDNVGTQNTDPEDDGCAADDHTAHTMNQGQDDHGSDRADSRDNDGDAQGTTCEDDGATHGDRSEDGDSPDYGDNIHDIEHKEGGSKLGHNQAPDISYTANLDVHVTDEEDEGVVDDGHHVHQKIKDDDDEKKKVAVDAGSDQNIEDAEDDTKDDEDMDRDREGEDATEMGTVTVTVTVTGHDATDRDDNNITPEKNLEYKTTKIEVLPTAEDQSEEIKAAENVEKNDEEDQKTGIQVFL